MGESVSNGQKDAHVAAPVGIIIPPPDIREIIEKTAAYVHRNGQAFEAQIRDREKSNTRFSFLNPFDPYFPFYEWRVDEHKEHRSNLNNGTAQPQPTDATQTQKNEQTLAQPKPLAFAVPMPPISAQDLDILRLTALFVAKNGRQFSNVLAQREEQNFQFDFLRPNHSLHPFFMRLVDQYRQVLNPSNELRKTLDENLSNKLRVLESAQQRADWQKHQEAETKKAAEEADAERIAYAQIDWHDFVIVETIEFTAADRDIDLPAPMSLSELEHTSLEQKQMMSLFHDASQVPAEDLSQTEYVGEHFDQAEPEPVPTEVQVPLVPVPVPQPDETFEEQRIRERQEALRRQRQAEAAAQNPGLQNIKVLPQGSRRGVNRAPRVAMQECPLCHQQIPAGEFDEHMRIELLHPKWKEEKAKLEARNAISNLAFNEVTQNIKRLASARTDLFASDGTALTPEEAQRQQRRRL
ncbi:Pre-mRNA splicing factor PRP21 like protein-domain-containing protein [Lipomyces arxii]|uniref:Pre-mRNA splicing factor PRP21 like protein-domain-containing protein n=1 Tax=Lipomyces arxii TaxID=56418 RepID=UPI0034CE329A